jgi:hypothetical protein
MVQLPVKGISVSESKFGAWGSGLGEAVSGVVFRVDKSGLLADDDGCRILV